MDRVPCSAVVSNFFQGGIYYRSLNTGPANSGVMTQWCVARLESTPLFADRTLCAAGRFDANGGFGMLLQLTGWNARYINGAGAAVSTPISPWLQYDFGGCVVLHSTIDTGAGFVRMYKNGVEAGAGTAIVGYTACNYAARSFMVGILDDTTSGALRFAGVLAAGVVNGTAMSAAQCLAHSQAIQAAFNAGRVCPEPSGIPATYLLDASDAVDPATGLPRATWTDRVGGQVLTRAGDTQVYAAQARF